MYKWLITQLQKQLTLAHQDATRAGYGQDHPLHGLLDKVEESI